MAKTLLPHFDSTRLCRRSLTVAGSSKPGRVRWVEGADFQPQKRGGAKVVFYTHSLCPYAQRVWCALEEKGVEYTQVQIDLSSKPEWYREVAGNGLVPAVEFRGQVVTESSRICRWIDDEFSGPSLMPSEDEARDAVNLVLDKAEEICRAGLSLLGGTTSYSWGIGSSPSRSQISSFESSLETMNLAFKGLGGPYIGGDHVTLADLVVFPFLERFDLAMPEFSGYLPSDCCDGWIRTWLNAMSDRDAIRTTMADRSMMMSALKQHGSLDFFDYHSYALGQLHPHIAHLSGRRI